MGWLELELLSRIYCLDLPLHNLPVLADDMFKIPSSLPSPFLNCSCVMKDQSDRVVKEVSPLHDAIASVDMHVGMNAFNSF